MMNFAYLQIYGKQSLATCPSQMSHFATPPAKTSSKRSQIEHDMETIMFTFHKFAEDKGYLVKEDLRVLMKKEFPGLQKIKKALWPCFHSFSSLTAGLIITCNDYFVVPMKQKRKNQSNSFCTDKNSPNGLLKQSLPHSFSLYKDFMNILGPLKNVKIVYGHATLNMPDLV